MDLNMLVLILVGGLHFLVSKPTLALNEPCSADSDCQSLEKSVCLNDVCSCEEPVYYYLEGQQKCVKLATEFGAICFENKQCSDFLGSNSQCNEVTNTCSCQEGYRWYQGKCQKYAGKGETCDAGLICLDPGNPLSLNCTDAGICECSEGYYDRGYDCRWESKVDEECAISKDCLPSCNVFHVPETSHCELGICVKDDGTPQVNSSSDDDCEPLYSPFVAFELTPAIDNCPDLPLANFTEQQCRDCSRTSFFQGSACICAPGYFLLDDQCVAELGVLDPTKNYLNDSDCPIKPGKLANGACYCKNYWFQDDTNRECKKTTLQFIGSCMDNDWCRAMGSYAFCNATEQCECISEAVLNETTFYCELRDDANLDEICLSDAGCPLYETCQNERCECTEGFYRPNDTALCLPKIGSSCEVRDCSHIENARCSNEEVCMCQSDDYVTDDIHCLKTASKLYDECLIDLQCQHVPNSGCLLDSTSANSTKRCLCNEEFLDVDGVCYAHREFGSLCSTQTDCTVILGETFVCRNMLCQCPIGQSLNGDNVCVSTSSSTRLSVSVLTLLLIWFSVVVNL